MVCVWSGVWLVDARWNTLLQAHVHQNKLSVGVTGRSGAGKSIGCLEPIP